MIERALATLRGVLPPDRLIRLEEEGALRLLPASVPEVQEILRAAARDAIPLVIEGGGTAYGHDAGRAACRLSTLGLTAEPRHDPEDLVASFGAGTTLADAQEFVGRHGQQLPLSAPHPARATLGGIVAAAGEGWTLAAYGPVRDLVLGIEAVRADGKLTRAGGRVVKNVTGFDLMRLYTGSRGRLGVITRLHLRLRPRPEAERSLVCACEGLSQALELGWRAREELKEAFAVHVLCGAPFEGAPVGGALLVLSLRGAAPFVDGLAREAGKLLDGAAPPEGKALPDLQTPFPADWRTPAYALIPAAARAAAERLEKSLPSGGGLVVDILTGRIVAGHPHAPSSEEEEALRSIVTEAGGSPPPGAVAQRLAKAVARALDPAGILS